MTTNSTLFLSVLLALIIPDAAIAQDAERYEFTSRHMGSDFRIVLYADSDFIAEAASDSAFARIEQLNYVMSDYIDVSELNLLSRTSGSGKRVKLSEDLFKVLSEAQCISYQTKGIFDVTIGPMTKSWRELRRSASPTLPSSNELDELKQRVGFEYLILNSEEQSARLLRKNMALDLGGIGKGFAADEALNVLKSFGIHSALIDAGGDVTLGEPPAGRESWITAVPKKVTREGTEMIRLQMVNRSVATSGDLFQFAMVDGVRYSHILDPKTGFGSTLQIQATVVSKTGSKADAYASVLSLMQPEAGIRFVEQLPDTEAILFVKSGDEITEYTSPGMSRFLMEDQE